MMKTTRPIMRFMSSNTNASLLLFIAAILAAIVANSPLAGMYSSFFDAKVSFQMGHFNLLSHNGEPLTVLAFVNDALMTVFFFMVGLEIKRELLVGEISSMRKAALPFIAACGGMILPVVVYSIICSQGGGEGANGLAIPMATDIAFSLGVLSLLGNRVPIGMKIFLTAFAVIDDIGGILVIALFYSSHLAVEYLLISLIFFFILYLGNRYDVNNKTFYFLIGIAIWYLFLQSGIHSTIAGVLIAVFVPARPKLKIGRYLERIRRYIKKFPASQENSIILTNEQIETLKRLEAASDNVISPLQAMEDGLHRFVNFFILPVFAFTNAGVMLSGGNGEIMGIVTIAVALGLIIGKFSGIFLFTFLAVKTKIVEIPKGVNWKGLAGISLLGGIGFTVSLFIANLSFGDNLVLLNQAKLGVILGTIISGIAGYIVLHLALPKKREIME